MSRDELSALLDEIGPDEGPAPVDDAWLALTMGELDDDAAAGLRASAATSQRDSDLLDLYDPLESDVATRIAQRVVKMRPETPAPVEFATQPWEVPEAPVAPAAAEPSLWSRLRAWWGMPLLLPMLAVASLMLMVQPEPQLAYSGEILSGDRADRNDAIPAGSVHARGSMVEVKLTPDGERAGVTSIAGVLRVGGAQTVVSPGFEVGADGSVLVRMSVPEDAAVGGGTLSLTLSGAQGAGQVDVPIVISAAP